MNFIKILGISLALFITLAVEAAPWSEIENHSTLELKKDLPVTGGIVLPAGGRFLVDDLEILDALNVETASLQMLPCPESIGTKNIDLLILEDRYGFELKAGCKVSLYLEMKDFYQESYFQVVKP